MDNYGYQLGRPNSAVINTGGAVQVNPQRTTLVHAAPTCGGGYKVAYVSPITSQPASGQIMMAPTSCQAQYPMVVDLGEAYKTSVGGQCQPCSGASATTTTPTKRTPMRINRCCPGCAPCCCGECDTYEDYPRQDCMCCGGCPPPPQPGAPSHQAVAPPQDCCACHGCQTMCCGQPCCVCHPCQTNCCEPTSSGPNGAPNGCCGPNQCCDPNGGCCSPYGCCGNCCNPNGCCGNCCNPNGCCGNCCQPVEVRPMATQPTPVTTQPMPAITVAPTNGPYTYRTSYNLAGFVPYNGQPVAMVPVDNKFVWGGAAVQPFTNVARQVFTQ